MVSKTLAEAMPEELTTCEYDETRAYGMRDVVVVKEHCSMTDQDDYQYWPGKHKNIFFWVELENGFLVGWNENPERGWSFPVIRNPFLK